MIDAATSANDFDLRELRKRPISIFVQINPDNIARLQPLLNLFFQQAIGLQTRELPEHNPALRHQLLLMLDEFPALGRIPVIAESTAFLPGYNVRTVIIVQSNSQLVEKYGLEGAKSIRKMLAARIVFPPREYDDAEAISRELGTRTVRQRSISRPMWGGAGKSASVTISDQPRRLLLPQEIKELGSSRMILFYEGLRPVLAQRIFYFRDKVFASRELPPPPVPKLDVARSGCAVTAAGAVPADSEAAAAGECPALPADPGAPRPRGRPASTKDADVRRGGQQDDEWRLEDFSFDFDDVEIPVEKLSEEDLQRCADAFMAQVLD